MTATIYRDNSGQWRWRIKSRNGRIMADSGESYTRKMKCAAAIQKIVDAIFFDRFDVEEEVECNGKQSSPR